MTHVPICRVGDQLAKFSIKILEWMVDCENPDVLASGYGYYHLGLLSTPQPALHRSEIRGPSSQGPENPLGFPSRHSAALSKGHRLCSPTVPAHAGSAGLSR